MYKKNRNYLQVTSKFNKVLWYKTNTQKLFVFYMLAKNTWTLKFKLIPLTNYSKKKKKERKKYLSVNLTWIGLKCRKLQNDAERNQSSKQIEKHTTFMDWKTQYSKDVSSPQINIQVFYWGVVDT